MYADKVQNYQSSGTIKENCLLFVLACLTASITPGCSKLTFLSVQRFMCSPHVCEGFYWTLKKKEEKKRTDIRSACISASNPVFPRQAMNPI